MRTLPSMHPGEAQRGSAGPTRRTRLLTAILTALGPILALIALGFAFRRSGLLPEGSWPGLERLTYYVLFPALLVDALSGAPIDDTPWLSLVAIVGGVLGGAAGTLIFVQLRLAPLPGPTFTSVFQGGVRFNTYIALALVQAYLGARGVAAAAPVIACLIVMVNVACVTIFGVWGEGGRLGPRALAREILLNPLILACVIGGALGMSAWTLPTVAADTLGILGSAALPLGLLAVGAALRPEEVPGHLPATALASTVQFCLKPVLAFTLATLAALDPVTRAAVVIVFMTPTAPASYILARQLGGDTETMASIVTVQTALAFVLMPLIAWLALDVAR